MGLCTSFLEIVFFYNSLECVQVPPNHHHVYGHQVYQKPLITVTQILDENNGVSGQMAKKLMLIYGRGGYCVHLLLTGG